MQKRRSIIALVSIACLTAIAVKNDSPLPNAVGAQSNEIRVIRLENNDIVFDPQAERIYATLPSRAGVNGNSLVIINPVSGNIGPPTFVGSEPNKLAISDGGEYVYVGLDGAAAVRRFNLKTHMPELQFPLGSDPFFGLYYPEDIDVRPGCPNEVAVSRKRRDVSPRHGGVAIFANGVARTKTTPDHTGSNVIEFCNRASMLFGYNNESTEFGFRRMRVDETGVQTIDSLTLFSGFGNAFVCDGGRAYSGSGEVIDVATRGLVGSFAGIGFALVVSDSVSAKTIFLAQGSGPGTFRVIVYDQERFVALGSFDVPNVEGTPSSLIRWGDSGVAFRTPTQVFLIRSPLIGATAATGLANVSAATFRSARLARGSIASAFGTGLSPVELNADNVPLPFELGGTRLKIKDNLGVERLAPLFYVSSGQINYQVPPQTAAGTALIQVERDSSVVATREVRISDVAPGLFAANSDGRGVPAALALRVKNDGSQIYEPIARLSAQNRFVPLPIDLGPNQGTSTDLVFLVLFGTGIRFHTPSSITARVGCTDLPLAFAGPHQTFVGVDQVNLLLTRNLIGAGEIDVVLTMDGQTSNVVRIDIK